MSDTTDLVERVAEDIFARHAPPTETITFAASENRRVYRCTARAIIEEVADAVEEKIPGGTDIGLGPRENQGLIRVVRWLRQQAKEDGR